ncbi:MAG: GntR family transcriptional regulator [Salinibacter sp.]
MTADELDLTPVSAESPVPLYHQVESDLRRLIESGVLPPGTAVPPENILSEKYDVSRHTIRKAMSRLVNDDLIERSAGRGTFVAPEADRTRFYLDRSFTEQMADMGRRASSRVLRSEAGTIDEDAPEVLQPQLGSPCLHLSRVRLGDDEPIGIQHHTVVTEECPDLGDHDFSSASLYDLLAHEYDLRIGEIRHTISAAVADERQAELLDVAPGGPLLVVHTAAFLDSGPVIEHTTSYYRADRYVYRTNHTL